MSFLPCMFVTFVVMSGWVWLQHHDALISEWLHLTGVKPRTTTCDAYTAGYKEATLLACRRHNQRMRTLRDRLAQMSDIVPKDVIAAIELSMQVRVRGACNADDDDPYSCDHYAHFPEEGEFLGIPGPGSCYTRDPANNGSTVMWIMKTEAWHEEYMGVSGTLRVNRCTDPRAVLGRPVYGKQPRYDDVQSHITLPDGQTRCRSPALWYRIGPYSIDTDMEKSYDQ